jgi:C4-dicarboxylate-specific signal transduction histidine kinase
MENEAKGRDCFSRRGLCFGHSTPGRIHKGYVAIMRDITDRKMAEQRRARLQAALQQTQRLESLGRLAAGIAHDFNNILTNLVGYAELSVASLPKQNPAARYLEKVLDAANRAGELVGQIRAFSRQRGLERQPLHLIPVIEKTMKLLRSSLPPRAEARMALSPGVSPVLASEDQIRQILITLCVNSVLAMKQRGGGLLVVRLDEIDMHSQETLVPQDLRGEKYLRITVEDNGEAVDSRVLQGLFDPMAPDAETDIHRGIGLSVVHEIVSSLGGSVTASSMPGKGNAFLIYLPALESGA